MKKTTIAALVLTTALAGVGHALPVQTTFIELYVAAQSRLEEIGTPTTRAQEREVRALEQLLARGERDLPDLRKDLAFARKLAKLVNRRFRDNVRFDRALRAAFPRFELALQDRIEALRFAEVIEQPVFKKDPREALDRALDDAEALLAATREATDYGPKLRGLKRILSRLNKARRIANRMYPDGLPERELQPLPFVTGRNDFQMMVDGYLRSVTVDVPTSYDPLVPTPVCYCFPGTGQSIAEIHPKWEWDLQGEANGWIIVYCESLRLDLVTNERRQHKWNIPGIEQIVRPGTALPDDVRFVREVVDRIGATFNVDEKRQFGTGFSNGCNMPTSRLLPRMSDVFAAFGGAGGTLSGPFVPNARPAPALQYFVGTQDTAVQNALGAPGPFPYEPQEILEDSFLFDFITGLVTSVGADLTSPTTGIDPLAFTRIAYSAVGEDDGDCEFCMMDRAGHVYPPGNTVPSGLHLPAEFTEFFLAHPRR